MYRCVGKCIGVWVSGQSSDDWKQRLPILETCAGEGDFITTAATGFELS